MGVDAHCLLVRRNAQDAFASHVETALAKYGRNCLAVDVEQIADLRVELSPRGVWIDGTSIRSVLFTTAPRSGFCCGTVEEDSAFCDQETSALWLAAHQHPAVTPVNAIDAEVWYCRSEWATWYRRFRAARLPVGGLTLGLWDDSKPWLPWGGGVAKLPGRRAAESLLAAQPTTAELERVIVCYGQPLASTSFTAHAAAEKLASWGINLAELLLSSDGQLFSCTVFPNVPGERAAEAATKIAGAMNENLHRR